MCPLQRAPLSKPPMQRGVGGAQQTRVPTCLLWPCCFWAEPSSRARLHHWLTPALSSRNGAREEVRRSDVGLCVSEPSFLTTRTITPLPSPNPRSQALGYPNSWGQCGARALGNTATSGALSLQWAHPPTPHPSSAPSIDQQSLKPAQALGCTPGP